jgi:acyl-CoA synthetase (AMP-forming)/AMP-acid ligase II
MNHPFTNIRQILSLHNKVSPDQDFLTGITPEGREALSYAEFSARAHQTANLLQEDLQVKPGDLIAIKDNQPANAAVLFMACWLVGALPARYGTSTPVENAKLYLLREDNKFNPLPATYESIPKPVLQMGGKPSESPHFDTMVKGMPNTFFNEYPEPRLNTPAYFSKTYNSDRSEIYTQEMLLDAGEALANAQAITGNQNLITYMELGSVTYTHEVTLRTLGLLMATLLTGSSLIIDTRFYPHVQSEVFWREVAASRLHIACMSVEHLPKMIAFAKEQQAAGKPIYGEGVYQQDIKQLRHIYCPDIQPYDPLIRQFTEIYPFPIVTNG